MCCPCSLDACTKRKGLNAVGDRRGVFIVFAYALVACKPVFLAGARRCTAGVHLFTCATGLSPRPFVAVGITRIILTCNLQLQRPSVKVYFQAC